MARYGQGELVLGDARAIVPNPEAPYAPFFQFHLDAGGPGVERVFHQLLQHGCRPLDHFSGGDLIRKLRRQQGYGHGLAPGNDQHLPHADAVRGEIVRRLKARRINAMRAAMVTGYRSNFVARRISLLGLPGGKKRSRRRRLLPGEPEPLEIASAKRFWCRCERSSRASSGLEIKPVSTSKEGISGDFKTTKPACSTRSLCSRVRAPRASTTRPPAKRLWLRVPVMAISMSTWASTGSRSARLTAPTPPIKSDWFSLAGSGALLVAPRWERA